MQRIELNMTTGEQVVIDLTPEEIAAAQIQKAAWDAAQAQRAATPSMEEIVAQLQAEIAALKAK